jgi:hypothetical protein
MFFVHLYLHILYFFEFFFVFLPAMPALFCSPRTKEIWSQPYQRRMVQRGMPVLIAGRARTAVRRW